MDVDYRLDVDLSLTYMYISVITSLSIIGIGQLPEMSYCAKYMYLYTLYDKKIITCHFSYQIPHQLLVLISDLNPSSSLADTCISGHRADKGSDMKKEIMIHFVISIYE